MLQVIAQERAETDLAAALAASKVGPPAGVLTDAVILAEPVIAAEAVDEPAKRATPAGPRQRDLATEVPLRQRAERFAAPEPVPAAVAESRFAPPPVAAPRRNWGDWLSAFMEERNIRWGELVGGLLIVCSSIALVISFWSTIDERPLLKFLLFNGVTAGLFGVGFYCEHRWRLRTTSQGLLTIGSLLVPLNFLAIAAFTTASAANNPLTLGGELFSVVLFSTLLYFGGRVLVGGEAVALACGVIVPSLAQLLVRRFVDPQSAPPVLWGLAALPLGCYWLVNGWSLARASARPALAEEQTNALFKFLGITSFAALLPLALLLFKTEQPLAALHELSVAVSLLGAVPLAVGLSGVATIGWRRTRRAAHGRRQRGHLRRAAVAGRPGGRLARAGRDAAHRAGRVRGLHVRGLANSYARGASVGRGLPGGELLAGRLSVRRTNRVARPAGARTGRHDRLGSNRRAVAAVGAGLCGCRVSVDAPHGGRIEHARVHRRCAGPGDDRPGRDQHGAGELVRLWPTR